MVIGASARVTAIKSLESFRVLESWQVGMAGEEDFSGKRSCHSEGRRKQICHARAKPELRTDVTPKRTGQVFDRLLVAARTSTVLTHQTSFLLRNIFYGTATMFAPTDDLFLDQSADVAIASYALTLIPRIPANVVP
mgnify:CR=1 FL=1